MGLYKTTTYKKQNSKWVPVKSKVEKAPHDYGRWQRSNEIERKSNQEKSYVDFETTRGGLNKKVTSVRTYFPDDIKIERKLITTSSRLPKSYKK